MCIYLKKRRALDQFFKIGRIPNLNDLFLQMYLSNCIDACSVQLKHVMMCRDVTRCTNLKNVTLPETPSSDPINQHNARDKPRGKPPFFQLPPN